MPKGAVLGYEVTTGLVGLRDKIRELEIGVGNLRGLGGDATLHLLQLRDQVEEEVAQLEADAVDVRAEKTRIETVDGILYRRTNDLMRELREKGGLAGVRRSLNPPEEHWWYYLDLFQAEKQRKAAIKAVSIIIGVLVVLIVGNYIMNRFFGLDPTERAARDHTNQAEQYVIVGEVEKAIPEYEAAVQIMPTLGDAWVNLGVLYEYVGRQEDAQAAFAKAQELITDPIEFYNLRARAYAGVGKPDEALAMVNEALKLNPDAAESLYIRANIYETQNKLSEAIADYDRAANLAQAQQQDALYVLARMRLGMLLQRGPQILPTEGTPQG